MIKSAAASEKFATQAIGLVRDFAAFAGRNGVRGAILAIAAAMSEGVGLVLLVPLLSIATAANGGAGRLYDAVLRVLDLAGAQTRAGAAVAAASAFLSRSWCYGP